VISGIVASLIAGAIVALVTAFYRRFHGQRIKITHPRPNETLTDPEPLGQARAFPIRGTLKKLPAHHEIWLLTQDEASERLWPQGFYNVKYDHQQQTWVGKINGSGRKNVKIIAVVAPPTSQDFFRYYQHLGGLRGNQFEPLSRVPAECRNQTSVQAQIP
jgi:hypothetical protein